MRAALFSVFSVGAFAMALSPLVIGTLPMTWSTWDWPSASSTQRIDPRDGADAIERGTASVIATMLEGRRTVNGERADADEFTAAHRTLPLGTRVEVTNVGTGKSVAVRINDRGPFVRERVIDLSPQAAEALGIEPGQGRAEVRLRVIARPSESI